MMASALTNDFWAISLPAALESSSARNPELFAYVAAQNRLGAPVLFSHKKVSDLIDPALKTKKKALERHHLFPRAWQERRAKPTSRSSTSWRTSPCLRWPENIAISDDPPSVYVPKLKERHTSDEWQRMHELHALPDQWESLGYWDFLDARRRLMAGIIRRGFEGL